MWSHEDLARIVEFVTFPVVGYSNVSFKLRCFVPLNFNDEYLLPMLCIVAL